MSTCISRSGEFSEHVFPASPGPADPADDYCQRCGVLNENRLAQEVARLKAEITKLENKIDWWEAEWIDSENERIDAVEEFDRARKAVCEAMELTNRDGPAAGMDRVAMWVDEWPRFDKPDVSYDWLSRWLVTDRVSV